MLVGKTVEEFQVEKAEVKFRYPEMGDAKDLKELINSLVEEGANITINKKQSLEEEINWLSETLKRIEKGKEVDLLVEYNGKVMGNSGVRKKEGTQSHLGELGILLNRKIRGKGIGTKLMKNLIKEAKKELGIEIITLKVYQENESARKLYEKLGFDEVGRIKDGYHNSEYNDLIIMAKDLRRGGEGSKT